jgi:hypothetical protein
MKLSRPGMYTETTERRFMDLAANIQHEPSDLPLQHYTASSRRIILFTGMLVRINHVINLHSDKRFELVDTHQTSSSVERNAEGRALAPPFFMVHPVALLHVHQ